MDCALQAAHGSPCCFYRYGNINEWDVSLITDMAGLFEDTDFGVV